jgi:hypothetical protein
MAFHEDSIFKKQDAIAGGIAHAQTILFIRVCIRCADWNVKPHRLVGTHRLMHTIS